MSLIKKFFGGENDKTLSTEVFREPHGRFTSFMWRKLPHPHNAYIDIEKLSAIGPNYIVADGIRYDVPEHWVKELRAEFGLD